MPQINSVVSDSLIRGAYSRAQSLVEAPGEFGMPSSGSQSFADMLGQATRDAINTVHSADATIQQGLQGKVGTQQVVEATLAMESTVKLSVALRDKLVEAYQQIMQMQI